MCHGANKIQKKKLETSGFRKSEFRIQNSEFRKLIWETGFQNRETGILKVGNWTGKLQNSESQDSEFRKLQNWETGPGNFQDSEFRKLDAIRYAIVFHWFWSVGLSPKTPPQAD